MNKIIVIFIDTVAAKNKLQLDAINRLGLECHIFLYYIKPETDQFLSPGQTLEKLSKNPFRQAFQVFNYLKKNAQTIHHLEVYPGSMLSFFYILTGKIFGIKSICAERGDLTYYLNKSYHLLTRISMWYCYRFSHLIWYRELFMRPALERMGSKNFFFLHNAVPIPRDISGFENRETDFLWLNRIIPERRADWFVRILHMKEFEYTRNVLVGLLKEGPYQKMQNDILAGKPDHLTIIEFSASADTYYNTSTFFVLPSAFTFANNALLEAMSYGVIPLISDQKGSSLIVEHGVSGLIFQHTFEGFQNAMEQALKMDKTERKAMAHAARQKIINDFSEGNYFKKLGEMYRLIEKQNL